MPSRLVSVCDSRLLDASRPHGGKFFSSDELMALREYFIRRADDVPIDARNFPTFPNWDQHSHNPGSLCDGAASDQAEYGDSVQYHSSSQGHSDFGGSTRSKQEGPLSATRTESERVAPDNATPLAEIDTYLNLYGGPSRPLKISSPTDAEHAHSEEMQDTLPDFLDLSPDIESPEPQQLTHEIPPLGNVSRFLTRDESPAAVPEGEIAGPSGGRNPKRFGGNWADPVLAEPPTSTHLVPRRVHSAAELASGHRFPTQVQLVRAAAARATEATRGGYASRGYNAGTTGPAAEYGGGHAYSRSAVEPSELWRRDPYYDKRVQGLRNGDVQNLKRGVHVAADANAARETLSREMGSVVQRNRMMSPQDVVGPASSTLRRPRASSAAPSPTPSLSPRYENRYRTLGDRAYHHPDVPRTPLFSDHDCDPSSLGPGDVVAHLRGSSTRRGHDSDIDDRLISSPETESNFPSPQSEYSQNSLSPGIPPPARRPLLRARAPSGPAAGDEFYPSRESYARRPASSFSHDLPRGHSLHIGLPSASSLGIGLSTVDNGAFEAPRPAPPTPPSRTPGKSHPPVAWRRKHNNLRILTGSSDEENSGRGSPVFKMPLRSLSLTRKGPSQHVTVPAAADRAASPVVGFGATSFRWQIWSSSKVQRPSERSDTPVGGRLRAAGKSEPNFTASFIETEAKPQRKGLLFSRKKS